MLTVMIGRGKVGSVVACRLDHHKADLSTGVCPLEPIRPSAVAGHVRHRHLRHVQLGCDPGLAATYEKSGVGDVELGFRARRSRGYVGRRWTVVVFYVGARNDGDRARYFPDAEIPKRRARLDAAWHEVRLLRLAEVTIDRSYRGLFRKLRSREGRARVSPDAFRSNVTRMLRRIDEAGIPGVIVIPPLSRTFEENEPQMRRYREILAEVAGEQQVPTVSVDARFAAAEEAALYFEDDYHLRAPGHALVAEEITKLLATR